MLGVGKKFGNDEIWNDIIKEVDVNGDGEVSYEEFKLMMTNFLSQVTLWKGLLNNNHKTVLYLDFLTALNI